MKLDKIMEEYIEMGNSYKQKEQELYNAFEISLRKNREFNELSQKLLANQEILKTVYQEEFSEFSKSKLNMDDFNPFGKEENRFNLLKEKYKEDKVSQIKDFDIDFELLNKIYTNDKLSSNLPEKNIKPGVNKI